MKLTKLNLAFFLLLPALMWAQQPAGSGPGDFSSGLAPGDQLTVRMYDFPDMGGPVLVHVGADGTVHLPYAGTLQVKGLSPEQFQEAISKALQTKGIVKDPNVTVDVLAAVNLSVNVLGQVLNPKSIPLYSPAPVSYILAQVGGISGLAERRLTILHRGEQLPTSVEYDPDAPNQAAMNTLVMPGDVVTVSARGVYFVCGEVYRPGIFPLGGALSIGQVNPTSGQGVVKHLTLLEALAQAGGVTAIAARSKMHILRTVDGKRVDIQVDQVKLSKGEVADPILQRDDIIYVPPSYWRQQTNNLFSTAVSSLYAAASVKDANF